MGRAITYCVQCSKRVSDTDLETAKAFRIGDRILCKTCAPDSVKIQTTKKVQRPKDFGTSVTLKAQQNPPAAPPTAPPVPMDRRKKLILFGGGVAATLVLLVLVIVLMFRSSPAPAVALPPDNPTPAPDPTPAPIDPKAASAKADLEKARAFAKAHAEDPAASMKEFNEIVWKWEGTEAAKEAAKEAAAIKTDINDKVRAWMLEAEAQIKPLVDKGELRAAGRRMEEFKPLHDLLEWRQAVEARWSQLRVDAVKLEEKKKAEEEGLAGANPPKSVEKTLSEEGKTYPGKWEAAVGRATARDYAAAIAELERLAAGLKEADAREEAAQDVKDLKSIAAVFKSSLDALQKRPRGSTLTVQARMASGETKQVSGMVLQIDAQRFEVQAGKTTSFVEWEDVATSTLAQLAHTPKSNVRILAELCLLEGEVDAAKTYEADLSPKWWTYGAKARSLVSKADPGEKSARDVYYAAEKGFRSMETRAAAIESYKTLKTDFSSTALVKVYAERIALRTELGKEYYFAPGDFHAEGTFRLAKSGKLESAKDSDDPDTLRNVAEIEFAALPGLTYRCWLWAGACCEETFLFYLQGTDVIDTDPKTKKKLACEPGSNVASPVKNSIRGLKKTHVEHKIKGAKEHPKTAARWEWIEIPLPKYAAAGGKKLRFMTNQAGFSIGGAVVSSSRKGAPAEPELKDLEKDREVVEALPVDADLVAWWTFEEGSGNVAADATGKGHEAKGSGPLQWVDGKIGGGVRISATGPALRVEDAEDLRLPGDLTLALWMKKEGDAGDWSCLLGKGEKQQRNYCLWLEAGTRQVLFQEYGAAQVGLKTKSGVPDGAWTHLAAVVAGNKAILYVNGTKDGEQTRGGASSAVHYPVGMGWACEHGTYRGVLDDVRIYKRALNADEIRSLVEQSR